MFKITLVVLGKFKESSYIQLEKEYLKRLSLFAKVKIIELSEVGYGKNMDMDRVKEQEAEKIVKALPKDAVVILLEERGVLRDSLDFSKFIERVGSLGKELVFVIGSGIGLHSSLKAFSNYSVSLSPLTFPHNLARIILQEQLYRACMILGNREYHK